MCMGHSISDLQLDFYYWQKFFSNILYSKIIDTYFFISKKKICLQDMIFWNFEFAKSEQFSITDYSENIRRR